ncbi:MAG: amino acid ABC transporter ATP-binding protein [Cyanobacteria bacterium HKST-UBA04]|nr:amino acid ABC transporter ATP-binding protein [Cyanobacteria bacterium HKST-UBA04]MCA9841053.1 amino acid ABC transporter ATP-binding protein [Cyanobacteria bacterium HKST-UBA03]
MLLVKDVIKQYGRLRVLNGLTAEFRTGAINVVLGPSGCGKTTLFNIISGLEPMDYGALFWDDKLVLEAGQPSRLETGDIGYVLQGYSMFTHLTVLENLMLAPRLVRNISKAEAEAYALSILDRFNLVDKRNAYPTTLSGGQQQRAVIARAIMMNPKLLILDEPTNALDPKLISTLEQTLLQLVADGLTLIVSTHHLGFAMRLADYSYFLYRGELLEWSRKADLLLNPTNPIVQDYIQQDAHLHEIPRPPRAHHNDSDEGPRP